ncbi:Tyrosine recombinase XerC [compost metagenome]
MADNLIQKKGESTWYVRLQVPADVQDALGAKVLIQSLKTGLRKEAMERRLQILAMWKSRIKEAREGTPMPADWQDNFLTKLHDIDQLVTQSQMDAMRGVEVDTPEPTDQELETFKKLGPEVLWALNDLYERRQRQPRGDFRFIEDIGQMSKLLAKTKLTSGYNVTPEQEAEADALIADPASHKVRSPITTARVKSFREFRESRGGDPKHVDQQVGKMERLSDFLKTEGLVLNFDTVDTWLKSLNRAPATLGQYLMAGTAFWNWAMKYDAAWRVEYKDKVNPFKGHDLPQGGGSELAGQSREIYTRDDTLKLRKAALDSKDKPLADLITLGWYTGARIEELCQLKKDSVITVDGIRCFDFPKSKSKASKRVVPIHPSLLSTIDRLCEDTTDTFLIPTDSGDKYGKRSHAASKAFGRLRKKAGFSLLHVFHSFRHTVVTHLVRADVPDPLAKELVGHREGSVTHDVYSKGASTVQKLAAISKLPALSI